MGARIRSAGVIAALLVILLSSPVLAQEVNIGVSPAEVHTDNLSPGETAEFELTIYNDDEIAHNFTITAFPPPKEERREGRAEFPDSDWITFCPAQVTVAANSRANATVTVAIGQGQKWAGSDWEIWLAVTPESSDLIRAKLYVRLLVSTSGMRFNPALFAAIGVAVALSGYGSYRYFRRKAKPQ
jgi:hypothetical protein